MMKTETHPIKILVKLSLNSQLFAFSSGRIDAGWSRGWLQVHLNPFISLYFNLKSNLDQRTWTGLADPSSGFQDSITWRINWHLIPSKLFTAIDVSINRDSELINQEVIQIDPGGFWWILMDSDESPRRIEMDRKWIFEVPAPIGGF